MVFTILFQRHVTKSYCNTLYSVLFCIESCCKHGLYTRSKQQQAQSHFGAQTCYPTILNIKLENGQYTLSANFSWTTSDDRHIHEHVCV